MSLATLNHFQMVTLIQQLDADWQRALKVTDEPSMMETNVGVSAETNSLMFWGSSAIDVADLSG